MITQNWQKSNAKNKKQQKTIYFLIVILVIFRLWWFLLIIHNVQRIFKYQKITLEKGDDFLMSSIQDWHILSLFTVHLNPALSYCYQRLCLIKTNLHLLEWSPSEVEALFTLKPLLDAVKLIYPLTDIES